MPPLDDIPILDRNKWLKLPSVICVYIDMKGMRQTEDRYDRQNEVWAGRPVNMAAKLASLTADDQLLVSERFHSKLTDEKARSACACSGGASLWEKVDVSAPPGRFDFTTAYRLVANWCQKHGKEFMEALLACDEGKK